MSTDLSSNTTAGFITLGLTRAFDLKLLTEHWHGGQAELIAAPLAFMPYLAAMEATALREVGDYPGVYDYEVSEVFGHWYAEQIMENLDGGEPPESLARAYIRSLLVNFFGACDGRTPAKLEHLARLLDDASQAYLAGAASVADKGRSVRAAVGHILTESDQGEFVALSEGAKGPIEGPTPD